MPEINWLAVVTAAMVVFVVSFVYYTVFGAARASVSEAGADAARPPAWKIFIEILRSVVGGAVIAGLISLLGITDVAGAVQLGLVLWIAFPVILLMGSVMWENVAPKLAVIHAGDWLLKLLIIPIILTLWR